MASAGNADQQLVQQLQQQLEEQVHICTQQGQDLEQAVEAEEGALCLSAMWEQGYNSASEGYANTLKKLEQAKGDLADTNETLEQIRRQLDAAAEQANKRGAQIGFPLHTHAIQVRISKP